MFYYMFCGARYGNWVVSKASNELPPRPLRSEPPPKIKGGSGGVYKGGKFWTFLDQIEGVLKLPQVSPVMFLRCSKGPIGQYLNQLNC